MWIDHQLSAICPASLWPFTCCTCDTPPPLLRTSSQLPLRAPQVQLASRLQLPLKERQLVWLVCWPQAPRPGIQVVAQPAAQRLTSITHRAILTCAAPRALGLQRTCAQQWTALGGLAGAGAGICERVRGDVWCHTVPGAGGLQRLHVCAQRRGAWYRTCRCRAGANSQMVKIVEVACHWWQTWAHLPLQSTCP